MSQRRWGYVDYQSDWEQWEHHNVPESPQKAAEDMKAQGEPGQGLLLLQWDVFLPKHIKGATEDARGGKDNTLLLARWGAPLSKIWSPKRTKTFKGCAQQASNELAALTPQPLHLWHHHCHPIRVRATSVPRGTNSRASLWIRSDAEHPLSSVGTSITGSGSPNWSLTAAGLLLL